MAISPKMKMKTHVKSLWTTTEKETGEMIGGRGFSVSDLFLDFTGEQTNT